ADDPELPGEWSGTQREYQIWLRQHDFHALPTVHNSPLISLVMPIFRPNLVHLQERVASIQAQSNPRWELCLMDDGTNDPDLTAYLHRLAQIDPRIRYTARADNRGISAATNGVLKTSHGEYVAFMDQDDRLHPQALQAVASAIQNQPRDLYFTDEDRLDELGRRVEPFFKPGWSPELLRSMMYLGHLCVYRRAWLHQIGPCDSRLRA